MRGGYWKLLRTIPKLRLRLPPIAGMTAGNVEFAIGEPSALNKEFRMMKGDSASSAE